MTQEERPETESIMPSAQDDNNDPIVEIVTALAARFRDFTAQPGAVLTCELLVQVIGNRAHILSVFIFCLLNLLPGPPGYAVVMAIIITALWIMLLLGREIHLWPVVGRVKLPTKLMLKLVGMLSNLTAVIARISSPRLKPIAGPAAVPIIAIVGIVLGVAMVVPIPFTNTIPSIGLAVVCIGLLNRDGILVLAGLLIGMVGLGILFASIWFIFTLGEAIEDAVMK